jgi:hypothetical protein
MVSSARFQVFVLGLALQALFAGALLAQFPLAAHFDSPLLDLGKLTGYRRPAGYLFLAGTALQFGLYYVAFRIVRGAGPVHNRSIALIVAAFALSFSATLAFVYPYGAADIFDYVFYGRIIAHYGANPFFVAPADFGGDPFLPFVAWRYLPFTYGPAWAFASGLLSSLGGDSLLANLLIYKGAVIVALGACLGLIYGIARRIKPEHATAALVMFAWNPLVLTETAANGHNDVVMALFILLAIRMAMIGEARSGALAIGSLAVSALVKYVSAMVAPLYMANTWRRHGPAAAMAGVALGVMATLATFAPFWDGAGTFTVLKREGLFTASLPALLKLSVEAGGQDWAVPWVGRIALAGFGIYCLFEATRVRAGVESLIDGTYRVIVTYLLFACLWFQPWYLVWLIAVAALRRDLDTAHLSMLFSLTATLSYFVFIYIWIWNADRLDYFAVQAIAVATIYTLPLAFGFRLALGARRPGAAESPPVG